MNAKSPLARILLGPAAGLYGMAVRRRAAAYDKGSRSSESVGVPVISFGNITTGGTGKTPLVCYAARYLASEGRRVAILTRGYKRQSSGQRVLNDPRASAKSEGNNGSLPLDFREFGDEPLMLSRMLPTIPIVINANRVEGGRWVVRELGVDVLLLDDAYQHLAIKRDLNLLVLDATDPFGGQRLLPLGKLREPLEAMKRAGAVIVTRVSRATRQEEIAKTVRHICGSDVPIMHFASKLTAFHRLETCEHHPPEDLARSKVLGLSGIGNPKAFVNDLADAQLDVVGEASFADHHAYAQADIDSVTIRAKTLGADAIVTTEKDAVRLRGLKFSGVPVYVAESEPKSEDEDRLKALLIKSVVSTRPQ